MKYPRMLETHPLACKENQILGDHYRFTVLTESLVRMEYSPSGHFEDRATQVVLNRNFPAVSFDTAESEEELLIVTQKLRLSYQKNRPFTPHTLSVRLPGQYGSWRFGETDGNLKGTARTLDEVNGACELENGLFSMRGSAALDDSKSLVFTDDGFVAPRAHEEQDVYFFGYGSSFHEGVKDFYRLCGKTPMLPRFALGNWWSRYHAYSEESYLALMDAFEQEQVPFSVGIIDMDWHYVQEVDPKYGDGWTGFSWNPRYFPNPSRFLDALHRKGMKTALNLHPADGVRAFEDRYPDLAKAMGMDPKTEQPIPFDAADPAFLEAYFTHILHPMEEEGVDFWWIDWQQGTQTKIEGLDPLWVLNHCHFLDSAKNNKRPMTFSRYAGPGSHRYPIGFSGDTVITWESLQFQPKFTATAANIGYGWWSHDIGGHMNGYKNDELETRWYQLGVFSPINRLHSTNNPFNGKEPWRFDSKARAVMDRFLRLRHRLIPYLYTMNARAYEEDRPICEPLYYEYPAECPKASYRAYDFENEYWFGSELLAAPITTPELPGIDRAAQSVWLPNGDWFDFFTGLHYTGGRTITCYRKLDSFPLFAKAGAIVPMTAEIFGDAFLQNPKTLHLKCFAGADRTFTLYEDDNETDAYQHGDAVRTRFEQRWTEGKLVLHPAEGNRRLLPETRSYTLEFVGYDRLPQQVLVNGTAHAPQWVACTDGIEPTHAGSVLVLSDIPTDAVVEICFDAPPALSANETTALLFDFLNEAEISFDLKTQIYNLLTTPHSLAHRLSALAGMQLDADLTRCLTELLTADA